MAVRSHHGVVYCYFQAVVRILFVASVGFTMKLVGLFSPALAEKLLSVMFTPSNISDMKYKFSIRQLWQRPLMLVGLVWEMYQAEARRVAHPGRPAPDPPLVSRRDLTRRVQLLQLARAGRPLVVVFGSCT